MKLKFKKLSNKATMPTKAYPSDAGFDLYASETIIVPSHGIVTVPTGIALYIPVGFYGKVVSRSGNTIKRGFIIVEGTIDAGYVGMIGAMVYNTTDKDICIGVGERIAQIIIHSLPIVEGLEEADELSLSDRGTNGYGSSGW